MKSVCIIVQNVYDADPRVRRKAEALVGAGHAVDVLALRPAHGRKRYALDGVMVRTLRLDKARGSRARYFLEYGLFFLWAFTRVSWQMVRRRYAVIDVNSLPDFLIFAAVLARRLGARLILDLHELTPEFYMSKYGARHDSPMVRLLTSVERLSVRCADHVLTVTGPAHDLLMRRCLDASKSTVVMNAVDEDRFGGIESVPPDVSNGKFVMIYHGTLTRIYGLDIAIDAFSQSHEDMPAAELWILGSGPEQPGLKKLADERGLGSKVKIVGQVAFTDIPAWLKRADVGILPIRRDVFLDFSFPNKLPEFIVAGLPVIAAGLKTMRHYFSDEAVAYFEPDDSAALAAQMVRLYRDPPLRAALRLKAREEYAPIRWDFMKQRYLALIDAL